MQPKQAKILVVKCLVTVGFLCSLTVTTLAQTGTDKNEADRSQYDHGTPPQFASGVSSFGSYLSTDLGSVNLSNGALNFKIPVGTVGGRGFWLPLTLNYSNKVWSVNTGTDVSLDEHGHKRPRGPAAYAVYDDPDSPSHLFMRVAPGWTLGGPPTLSARGMGIYSFNNPNNGCTEYSYLLVKLTLVLPDKGEIELRDDKFDGAPLGAVTNPPIDRCRAMDGNRGRRWHATDGSGIIYIADKDNGVSLGDLSGVVITGDGTRYRFDSTENFPWLSAYLKTAARASSITDRNGNRVTISYSSDLDSQYAVKYTDQLGRTTKVALGVPDPVSGEPLAALITLPAFGGQGPTYYKIKTGVMNEHFRPDLNPNLPVINGDMDGREFDYDWGEPHISLFPGSWGGGAERIDTRSVLTQLILPDGRALKFAYNVFGEVAEVEMPTGGKVQYDYEYVNSLPSGNSQLFEVKPSVGEGGVGDCRPIDRAIVARRTYPSGNTLGPAESYWTYSYFGNYMDVQAKASDNFTLLFNQRHHFMPAQRFLTREGGTGYSLWSTGLERRTETLDAAGAVIAATEQDWSQRAPVSWGAYKANNPEQIANDNRVNEERKTLDNGLISKRRTNYQLGVRYNNPAEVWEYDYDGALKRKTVTSYVDGNTWINGIDYTADALHFISLPLTQTILDGDGNQIAQTTYEYDTYTEDGNHATLKGYGSVSQHEVAYDVGKVTRGNVTGIGRWLKRPTPRVIYAYSFYDVLGNVISIKDGRGYVSTVSYQDDFGDGSRPGAGVPGTYGPTYSLPTSITSPPPNPGEPAHTARSQYDFSTGLMTGFLNRNNVVTQTIYNDPYNRPTLVKAGLGLSRLEHHTAMYYAPATVDNITLTGNDVMSVNDLKTVDDAQLREWTKTDGFGRTVESWLKDPSGNVKSDTILDNLGRPNMTSNPYRPSQGESPVYTTTAYDLLGRVTSVTTPDNAVVRTSYIGNQVTVTDQADKDRQSTTDALGRLVQLVEDPGTGGLGFVTTYSYDALGNLRQVSQGGQSRSFEYDSLSRLVSAFNPESGTVNYQYDDNGNLTQKTDARLVTTSYLYDGLNRVTGRTYSDGTPSVIYAYDALANARGRLTSVSSSVSRTSYDEFDALGHVKRSTQTTDGQSYSFPNYEYDLAGNLTSQTYPSGRVVSTAYDNMGRISSVTGQQPAQAAPKLYVSNLSYSAHGAVREMQLGNNLWEHTFYNNRFQPQLIGLGTSQAIAGPKDLNRFRVDYYYGGTDNNGNVLQQTVSVPDAAGNYVLALNQVYDYDPLNRLAAAQESSGWKQVYVYDRYGNRTLGAGTNSPALPPGVTDPYVNPKINPDTNRIADNQGYSYDSAGNLIRDAVGHTYGYDANNLQISFDGGATASAGTTYVYDGDGKRVKKINGVSMDTTVFVYNTTGQMVAEYSSGRPPGPGGTSFLTTDTLGSPRVITDSNGVVKARHDYLPFGEELFVGRSQIAEYKADNVRQKFTGQERDYESGLDFFHARYYSSIQGRFMSTDPLLASAKRANPQTWNRYTYVMNNPLRLVDPTGMLSQDKGICAEQDKKQYEPIPLPQKVNDMIDRSFGPNTFETVDGSEHLIVQDSKEARSVIVKPATEVCNIAFKIAADSVGTSNNGMSPQTTQSEASTSTTNNDSNGSITVERGTPPSGTLQTPGTQSTSGTSVTESAPTAARYAALDSAIVQMTPGIVNSFLNTPITVRYNGQSSNARNVFTQASTEKAISSILGAARTACSVRAYELAPPR